MKHLAFNLYHQVNYFETRASQLPPVVDQRRNVRPRRLVLVNSLQVTGFTPCTLHFGRKYFMENGWRGSIGPSPTLCQEAWILDFRRNTRL